MALLVSLVPAGAEVVIDVGCDHGKVARALGAIGVERQPARLPAHDGPFVVADGLAPFRRVDVAVIAGIGPATLLGILRRGPRPRTLVAHCPVGMDRLRQGLADLGYRIDAEGLAREGSRIAEVLRAVEGAESAEGFALWFGPRLAGHPLLEEHRVLRIAHYEALRLRAPPATRARQQAVAWLEWLRRCQ